MIFPQTGYVFATTTYLRAAFPVGAAFLILSFGTVHSEIQIFQNQKLKNAAFYHKLYDITKASMWERAYYFKYMAPPEDLNLIQFAGGHQYIENNIYVD